MRTYINAKAVAHTVRSEFSARGVQLSQSESLEIAAKAFGAADWNTLSAKIKQAEALDRSDQGGIAELSWPEIARPFYEKHLTQEERGVQWSVLFGEARSLYGASADASSDRVLDLAHRWVDLSIATTGGNPDIRVKSAAAYSDALSDPQIAPKLPLSQGLLAWFAPALTAALRGREQA